MCPVRRRVTAVREFLLGGERAVTGQGGGVTAVGQLNGGGGGREVEGGRGARREDGEDRVQARSVDGVERGGDECKSAQRFSG